ncbi:MAG TPA: hypothetical protein ENK53_04600 [Thiotrichales bacterium]|nr:hypothetical protein [Thiotrichales bacterium]
MAPADAWRNLAGLFLLVSSTGVMAGPTPAPEAGLLEFLADWGEAGEWLDAELEAGRNDPRADVEEDSVKDGRKRDE